MADEPRFAKGDLNSVMAAFPHVGDWVRDFESRYGSRPIYYGPLDRDAKKDAKNNAASNSDEPQKPDSAGKPPTPESASARRTPASAKKPPPPKPDSTRKQPKPQKQCVNHEASRSQYLARSASNGSKTFKNGVDSKGVAREYSTSNKAKAAATAWLAKQKV